MNPIPSSRPLPVSPQAMADLLCTMIILVRGSSAENNPIWAYLCMKPSMASAFKFARERGGFDVGDYGTVLESGEGDMPPPAIMLRMERDYGVNHDLENQWLAAIEAEKTDAAN